MPAAEIDKAWERYKRYGDPQARNLIIERYAYLVKITAGRVVSSLPPTLDREDLVSAGIMGLIKAVDQFDPARQVKFETYAIALIRGAILELLRSEDWVPRSVRDRVKHLERTYSALETRLGRPPTEEEISQELGLPLEEYYQLLSDAGRTNMLSLDDLILGTQDAGESLHIADVLSDVTADPIAEVEQRETRRLLAEAIDRLPERERLVIALYYYEGLTFREIGRVLGVSESRVYQLHTQAVLRLRNYLQRDAGMFSSP
ncbi:MAG: FliA/WhiG family RNA polymerase sigma factor [Armatimonadota bacterium]|nr:FliA/WhiG family RNA polymerase sigma factor [Armatimonadota bacterium]MDW8105006.1 FliA/WhiG family RNA polymerase sigma factor [Armatimonadota bacterium]